MFKKVLTAAVLFAALSVSALMLRGDTMALTSITAKIERMRNVGTIKSPTVVAVVQNDSIYIKELELKGTWKTPESGSAAFPTQATAWFRNTTDDHPLRQLSWTGVVFDTTWVKTIIAPDTGKYVLNKSLKAEYKSGKWTLTGGAAANAGWMDTTGQYFVDVYAVRTSGDDSLYKTLTFQGAPGGTKNYTEALYEIKFVAEGRRLGDTLAPAPTYLKSGEASAKLHLKSGSALLGFPVRSNADSLRFVWRNTTGTFYSEVINIDFPSPSTLGLKPAVSVSNVPGPGFFAAGDTMSVNITLRSDSGQVLDWATNAQALGIQKVELLVSGPKRDYMWTMPLYNIVNNYVVLKYPRAAWAGRDSGVTFTNPIRVRIPVDSIAKFGTGTYTVYISAKRLFGATVEKSARFDVQVGTTSRDSLPMSSAIAGVSCATCHGVNGPTKHHGSAGVEDCNPCHADNFSQPMYKLMHVKHFKSPNYSDAGAPFAGCTPCHLNNSHDKFTSEAPIVCTECHVKVPYFPTDHAATAPLYATSGLSCATTNCHAGGGVGNFQTIATTHAAIGAKYTGRGFDANWTDELPVIDGVIDPVWLTADSVTTVSGIRIKALHDSTNVYLLARWTDGHKMYGTDSAASKSVSRNKWTYSGTAWAKSGDEDRLGISWKIDDTYGASCARTCHNEKATHASFNAKTDYWHWKATRTNPVGYSDDQVGTTSGRTNDTKISGAFGIDNQDSAGTLPKFMKPAPAPVNDFLFMSNAIAFVNSGWAAGATIPGYVVNDTAAIPVVGSQGDIKAKGVFYPATGEWVVEFKRKMNTGNSDDAQFVVGQTANFSIVKMDNTGSNHATQGVDIGVYRLTFEGNTTDVDDNGEKPLEFALKQNFPNPFNPSTSIAFSVPQKALVRLEVFDVSGRLVATVVDEVKEAGTHSVRWYGLNRAGHYVASGVYLYRLQAAGSIMTKKMLLIK
jgi:hypothetical protein